MFRRLAFCQYKQKLQEELPDMNENCTNLIKSKQIYQKAERQFKKGLEAQRD